jgi:hypothetical protein
MERPQLPSIYFEAQGVWNRRAGRATIFRDYDAALSEAVRLRHTIAKPGEFLDVVPLAGAVRGS